MLKANSPLETLLNQLTDQDLLKLGDEISRELSGRTQEERPMDNPGFCEDSDECCLPECEDISGQVWLIVIHGRAIAVNVVEDYGSLCDVSFSLDEPPFIMPRSYLRKQIIVVED